MSKKLFMLSSLVFAVLIALSFPTRSFAKEVTPSEADQDYEIIYDSNGNTVAYFYSSGILFVATKPVLKNYTEEEPAPWHEYADKVTSIVFTKSFDDLPVTSIGSYAFADFDKLETVMLPSTIKSIKSYAFSNCTSIKTFGCGESLSSISDAAFANCTSLETVLLPNNLFRIGTDNFNCQERPVVLASFKGGIAESYAKFSNGEVIFKDITHLHNFESLYSATESNVITLSGMESTAKWEYNPYTKTLRLYTVEQTDCNLTYGEKGWASLSGIVENLIIGEKVCTIGSENFKDFHNLITISFSLYLTKIEKDAFLRCYNLKELSFYRNDMAACDDSFFNNLPSNVLCLCHYSEIENSTFQTFLNKNFSTKSFEGTERFTSIYDDVSCANQYDGIKNLTKKSYYIDENGERVYYTQSWGYTACVTTSTAMMIERRAYLDDYKAQVGDFDQKTVAAIVKEISYDYILVNYSWDFVWGEHTTSYETLTKDDVPYEVTTNSYDKHNISQKTLQEYLSHHPEGVVAFNTQHAVLVIDYIEDGDDAGKYVVWDPATGNEHIRSFNSLNGNRGFKLDHIIYVDKN